MRLAACDQCDAKFGARLDLTLGLFAGANLRRASVGSASSAVRAPPKWLSSGRKVRGPTF